MPFSFCRIPLFKEDGKPRSDDPCGCRGGGLNSGRLGIASK